MSLLWILIFLTFLLFTKKLELSYLKCCVYSLSTTVRRTSDKMEVLAEYETYTSFSIDLNQIRTEMNKSTLCY